MKRSISWKILERILDFATEKTTGGKPVANPCKHGLFYTVFKQTLAISSVRPRPFSIPTASL